MPKISRHLLALMDVLGIGRAPLVGTSLGAHIAAHAATRAPERIPGLALVGALGIAPISREVAETIRRNVQIRERGGSSSILSEVHNTSILRTGLSTDYAVISTSLAPQNCHRPPLAHPRSGLERSDFVLWRIFPIAPSPASAHCARYGAALKRGDSAPRRRS